MVSPAGGGATVDGLCREAGVVTSDTVIERGGTADSGNPVTKIVVKIIIRNYRKLLKSKIRYTILIRAARAETHAETGKAAALNLPPHAISLNIDPRTNYRLSHPCLRTLLPQCVSAYSDPGRTLYLSDEPVQSPVSSMYPFMVVSAARRRIILTPHNHSAIKGPKLVRTS